MRLIDVDELLKRLNQLYEEQGLTSEWIGDDWDDGAGSVFNDIVAIINEQPTIEPVKRGHWAGKHNGFQVCSECREWTNAVFKYEYCPWCGAKMDGDNECQNK